MQIGDHALGRHFRFINSNLQIGSLVKSISKIDRMWWRNIVFLNQDLLEKSNIRFQGRLISLPVVTTSDGQEIVGGVDVRRSENEKNCQNGLFHCGGCRIRIGHVRWLANGVILASRYPPQRDCWEIELQILASTP